MRSTATRLSQERPCWRSNQPEPPPRVSPATPVVETRPPVVASPCACAALSNSAQVHPPPTRARRLVGSISRCFIGRTSTTRPSSLVDWPATACPPERIATERPSAAARSRADLTSAAVSQAAISRGRLSIIALNNARRSSYPSLSGPIHSIAFASSWTAPPATMRPDSTRGNAHQVRRTCDFSARGGWRATPSGSVSGGFDGTCRKSSLRTGRPSVVQPANATRRWAHCRRSGLSERLLPARVDYPSSGPQRGMSRSPGRR